jgi:translation initiation factor 2 subunit 3
VDNGKSTLVQALSGVWTAKHSEEMRRGITIRVGYADTAFYKCVDCAVYGTKGMCEACGSPAQFLRALSFVDCPGHHSLMVTMLAGAALMDGALLILDAIEKCPQPQDREHLAAAQITGINNIVILQNKIDVVDRDRTLENYDEIKTFVKGTPAENAPIIPISAQRKVNMDAVVETMERCIPTPKRDTSTSPIMYIVRSFDVNRPGTSVEDIKGGVVGGSALHGVFRVGDEIEIKPGIRVERGGRSYYEPIHSTIVSLLAGGKSVKEATCGGLIGIGTLLDPTMTKADSLVGNVLGQPGHLPSVLHDMTITVQLLDRLMGTQEMRTIEKIRTKEVLVLNVGTSVTAGVVTSARDDVVELTLRRPVCVESESRIAISRRVGDSWRLIGYALVS